MVSGALKDPRRIFPGQIYDVCLGALAPSPQPLSVPFFIILISRQCQNTTPISSGLRAFLFDTLGASLVEHERATYI